MNTYDPHRDTLILATCEPAYAAPVAGFDGAVSVLYDDRNEVVGVTVTGLSEVVFRESLATGDDNGFATIRCPCEECRRRIFDWNSNDETIRLGCPRCKRTLRFHLSRGQGLATLKDTPKLRSP